MALEYPLDAVIKASSALTPVCGRMEVFSADNRPTVIVDYAHTPDALEKRYKRHAYTVLANCGVSLVVVVIEIKVSAH